MSFNPAKSVIEKVGGAETASRVTGKHISRVYRWTYPASRGGTGGVVPHEDAIKLLDFARENNIALTADDFMQAPSTVPEAPAESEQVKS